MSLKEVALKIEYRSLLDDITKEFYIPLLERAVVYKRAVGFFSSSSLVNISRGISGLIRNGGKIKLVISPNISDEDLKAVREGYKNRDQVIKETLLKALLTPENENQKDRLNYLANLIESGFLDIKVAVTEKNTNIGLYHEKMGIIIDSEGNRVAFSGSMNETANAFFVNYESIDVFRSWTNEEERVKIKEKAFDSIWENNEHGIHVYEFKEVSDAFISKYKTHNLNCRSYQEKEEKSAARRENQFFRVPEKVKFYEYQKDAMKEWFDNGCRGIYDMATGTGKTFTALGSISKLSEALDDSLAVIIVVPYLHLVKQWLEDIYEFNVTPIVACSSSLGKDWRKKFYNSIQSYNYGIEKHFCVITTTATFSTEDFQNNIKKFRKDFCLVVDEAHNLGATKNRKMLPSTARYRLALSATIKRHNDEEGTKALQQFFGKTCISFSLKEAIKKNFLTSYYYYPVIVHLNSDELEEYQFLTKQLSRLLASKTVEDEQVERLLIKRARIIAGCKEKVDKIVEIMKNFKKDSHMLVYCGATKYENIDKADDDDIRQIEEVTRRLGLELNMRVRKFTSAESPEERQEIKEMFLNRTIQAITAIRCLDEGVNIPAISRAFILASSTNPKEYIQRRGRVLRKHPGKEFAEIYDFITLPRPLDSVRYCSEEEKKYDRSLLEREFERMIDFADAARNPFEVDGLKLKLKDLYQIQENYLYGESFYD